jgi:HlyD family secretion protein
MGRKTVIAVVVVAVAVVVGLSVWWWVKKNRPATEVVLYGNVDLRQADLAFNNSQRIADVLVREGDHVMPGQVVARLETSRLQPQYDQAVAQAAAQNQALQRLRNGNRPEEIAQAKANLESAIADAANARQQYERLKTLAGRAISQQDVDSAKTAMDVANAHVAVSQKALDLQVLGPRKEDIAEAEAKYRANEATAAQLHQELIDAELKAPRDGVIRSRLMEPGEMASPTKPVFTLALTDPKWVRAYVSEPDLGKVRPGAKASVVVDSFPDRSFEGWVGFISPTAEFTPKTVQTTELRSSLVYEVRVFVKDPNDNLRLGMPATVHLSFDAPTTSTSPSTQPGVNWAD